MILQQSAISALTKSAALLAPVIPPPAQLTAISANIYPLVIIAIMIDALIVALWYMIGAVLANNAVKAGAKNEFWQVVGTAVIAGIVLGALLLFGGIYYQSVQGTAAQPSVLNPQEMLNTCYNVLGYDGRTPSAPVLAFAESATTTEFLSQTSSGGSAPNPSLCDIAYLVNENPSYGDGTAALDYPLAAVGIVNANLTNQVATEFNDLFVVDAFLNWQKKLQLTVGICIQDPDVGSCAAGPLLFAPPIPGAPASLADIDFQASPLAGLDLITKSLKAMSVLLYTALGTFIAQLLLIDILMFIWPWLIFVGLVLRGIFFTRKLGGLFIAIAIGAILIYPTVFAVEYLSANDSALYPTAGTPLNTPLTFCNNNSYSYSINFYNLPSIAGIAQDCGCWPWLTLTGSEIYDVVLIDTPIFWGSDLVTALYNTVTNGGSASGIIESFLPQNPGPFVEALTNVGGDACQLGQPNGNGTYSYGEGLAFSVAQAYGIIGITSFFLPIINILITLAGILGLSGLLGGDTQLAGLSRLI